MVAMFTYRRLSFISIAFLFVWLAVTLSYSFGGYCMCASHVEKHCNHHVKTDGDKCCSPKDDCSKNCQCQCISCGKISPKETLSESKFIPSYEKGELADLHHVSFDTLSLSGYKETHYQHITFPLKFLPLYLIKETFLL